MNNLTSLVDRNILSRNTKAKVHLPWIKRDIIRMQRKRSKSTQKQNKLGVTETGKGLGNSEDKPIKLQPNPTQTT